MINHPLEYRVHYIFLVCNLFAHYLLKRDMLSVDLEYEVIEHKCIVLICEYEQALGRFLCASEQSQKADSHSLDPDLEVKLE